MIKNPYNILAKFTGVWRFQSSSESQLQDFDIKQTASARGLDISLALFSGFS